jgi:type I restriction enzyme S subunit
MSQCISKRPLIVKVAPSKQHDRLDTIYYHPKFNDLEAALAMLGRELIPAEQIAELITDGTHQTPSYIEPGNDSIPLLSSTNIKENGIEINDLKHISLQEHLSLKKSNPKPNDVLLSVAGNIGTAAVFHGELDACSLLRSVALIRLKDAWEPEFVAVFINSKIGKLQIERLQKGIAVKTFRLGEINEFCLPLTTPPEQSCIIERYNHIRGKRREIEARISRCRHKQYVQSSKRIDEAFAQELSLGCFTTKEGNLVFLRNFTLAERLDVAANHPDYTKLVDQIKASENSGSLFELVEVSEDRFNPDECMGQEINYLAIGDIEGITGKIIEPQKMLAEDLPSRARRLIHAGDILIATVSQGDEKTVVFLADNAHEGWVASTGFLIVRAKKDVQAEYVVRVLKAPFVLRQYSALVAGSSMPTISQQDILNFAVPVTNPDAREKTLIEINKVLKEERQLTIQLEQISEQIEKLLSEAKSNIFDLLDDDKFSVMSARAMDIEAGMGKIEEALQ